MTRGSLRVDRVNVVQVGSSYRKDSLWAEGVVHLLQLDDAAVELEEVGVVGGAFGLRSGGEKGSTRGVEVLNEPWTCDADEDGRDVDVPRVVGGRG